MISQDLISLINSGRAVAIVGSGISVDAGVVGWESLFSSVANDLEMEGYQVVNARRLADDGAIPEAFDDLIQLTNRENIHNKIVELVRKVTVQGHLHRLLADWPFIFYLSPNYDSLLETASKGRLVPVGNRGGEIPKVTGNTRNFVWHLHGACNLDSEKSQLVVSKLDYDEFYPSSNLVDKLKAIATMYQCVYLGFGFRDRDLNLVMETVGRGSNRGRPSYAFIGYENESEESRSHVGQLQNKYNIDVIPYFISNGNHSDLHRVLDVYSSFVVPYSVKPKKQESTTNHAVASSLSIQSSLDIGLTVKTASLRQALIGARIMAYIRENPDTDDEEIKKIIPSLEVGANEVETCLSNLRREGIITPPPVLGIQEKYWSKTKEAKAQIQLNKDQFRSSLESRVFEETPHYSADAKDRILDVTTDFLDELCKKRGLGVAQNLATSNIGEASRRTASLVKHLPVNLSGCNDREESFSVVRLVTQILTEAREAESAYLGLLCQAYFGQHLVDASENLAQVDLDLISGTCYILDASVLISLLAEGSEGQEFLTDLFRDLTDCNAILTTTTLFISEITEHANWAVDFIRKNGEDSAHVLDVLRGKGLNRGNQFINGYFNEANPDSNFFDYIRRVLDTTSTKPITTDAISDCLKARDIQPVDFSEWAGFQESLLQRRDEVQKQIYRRRSGLGTFRHNRQTMAEAEVAILVDGIQRGKLQPSGGEAKDAFFLSSTRVVDQLQNMARRISLLPEGLAQWLWSAQATSSRHAHLVFQNLLWTLAEEGVEFVNRSTLLRKFSGVIEAADADLGTLTQSRREFLVQKYGADPENAFSDADPLDLPRFFEESRLETIERMAEELNASRQAAYASFSRHLTDEERDELEKFRAAKKARQRESRGKKRAAESRAGKKGPPVKKRKKKQDKKKKRKRDDDDDKKNPIKMAKSLSR